MAEIHVNAQNITGIVKPLNGLCNAPQKRTLKYWQKAGVPYTRLHDSFLGVWHVVDVSAVFPDFFQMLFPYLLPFSVSCFCCFSLSFRQNCDSLIIVWSAESSHTVLSDLTSASRSDEIQTSLSESSVPASVFRISERSACRTVSIVSSRSFPSSFTVISAYCS